jgi:hypothetical protein
MTPSPSLSTVDPQNPWLGLASFTEETRAYFHGRDEEVAELGRRVQRKLLTILFGQSGLGKTSILRAGLVPRLRPEGYCPVYVRIDYSAGSPPPSEQIKQAILRASREAGQWSQPGVAREGESLWEFLHHRDDTLRDAAGRALIPLLIFDQFEEIFTLAQGDESGRRRAAQFIEDLADLVENRAPRALEEKLEREEAGMERFDFGRADYRILIALREDYLAHLEGLKGRMPSVTQNRMRLARMTGAQALSAVTGPGRDLVTAEVAEAIVRFVSGAADLARAEVEPSLLSLVCRELNTARLAQGRAEISADLLAGSRDTILSEFYERALGDQPAGVRAFVEDVLLTDSGYRESIAEERVRKGFAAAGASPAALDALVDRRLLRIEERLDVRRVELTHDVLCGVVRASRASRHEREALEQAERELAAERAREAATRRALFRARLVAAVAVVLMLGAAGSALFGWINLRRARTAEQAANQAAERTAAVQRMANTARVQAEQLLAFLVDDFYRDLTATGQADLYERLARRLVDYYRTLPPELRNEASETNHALALAALGRALNAQNLTDAASEPLAEAIARLRKRRAAGDTSTEVARGLAVALLGQSRVLRNQYLGSQALQATIEAEEVLRPHAIAAGASTILRLEYAQGLMELGFQQTGQASLRREAEVNYGKAHDLLQELGGATSENPDIAGNYAFSLVRLAQVFQRRDSQGALEHMERAIPILDRLIERHPGHIRHLNARGIAHTARAMALQTEGKLAEAYEEAKKAEEDYARFLARATHDGAVLGNLIMNRRGLASTLDSFGRHGEAMQKLREARDSARGRTLSSSTASLLADVALRLAEAHSRLGQVREAEEAFAEYQRHHELSLQDVSTDGFTRLAVKESHMLARFRVERAGRKADATKSLTEADAVIARLKALNPSGPGSLESQERMLRQAEVHRRWCLMRLERYAEVEPLVRAELERALRGTGDGDLSAAGSVFFPARLLAQTLIGQERRGEARDLLAPYLAQLRERSAERDGYVTARLGLADTLVTLARAQEKSPPAERRTMLTEARELLEKLPAETRERAEAREVFERLAAEEAILNRGR